MLTELFPYTTHVILCFLKQYSEKKSISFTIFPKMPTAKQKKG